MSQSNDEQFELNAKDAHAIGVLTEHGFMVRAGATARKEVVPSAVDTVTPLRKRLLAEGVLIDDGHAYRFTKDHQFDSPSGAAAAVMGRTANGWIEWKRSDGQTLSKVKRVARDLREPLLTEDQRRRILEQHGLLGKSGKLLHRGSNNNMPFFSIILVLKFTDDYGVAKDQGHVAVEPCAICLWLSASEFGF